MASVKFDVEVGGDDTTVSDDNDAITGLGQGGHRSRFVPALANLVAIAGFMKTQAAIALSRFSDVETAAVTATSKAAEVVSNAAIVESTKNQMLNAIDSHQAANNNVFVATDSDLTDQTDIAAVLTASVDQDSSPNWVDQVQGLGYQTQVRTLGTYLGQYNSTGEAALNPSASNGAYYQRISDGKFFEISDFGGANKGTLTLRMGKANFPRNPVFIAKSPRITIWDADSSPMTPWGVMEASTLGNGAIANGRLLAVKPTALKYGNGCLVVTGDGSWSDGVVIINFATGAATYIKSGSINKYSKPIEMSNAVGGWQIVTNTSVSSATFSAVDMRVIAGTENNSAGMPEMGIALAGSNSLSLIKPNPTLETPVIVEATGYPFSYCKFSPCGRYVVGNTAGTVRIFSVNFDAGNYSSATLYLFTSTSILPHIGGTISALNFIEDHGEQVLHISSSSGHTFVKLGPTLADCIVRKGNDKYLSGPITYGTKVALSESSADLSDLIEVDYLNQIVANTVADWTPYGTNTIAEVDGGVEITHVDHSSGALQYLNSNDGLLSQDLVIGQSYELHLQIKVNTGASVRILTGGNDIGTVTVPFVSETFEDVYLHIVPSSAAPYIQLNSFGVSETANLKLISLKLAANSRVLSTNIVQLNGALQREAVADGCDVVGYKGFSAANNLQEKDTKSFDVGTAGDWYFDCWVIPTVVHEYLMERLSDGSDNNRMVFRINNNSLQSYSYSATGTNAALIGTIPIPANALLHARVQRRNGVRQVIANGKLDVSVADTMDMDEIMADLHLHVGGGGTTALGGASLLINPTWGEGSMSLEDIEWAYNSQLPTMQSQAKSLLPSALAGSSDDVHAADYDSSTNKLWVGQYGGSNGISVSAFTGLLRCDTLAPASIGGWNGHTVRRISANAGNLLLGKNDGVGGVIAMQPAIDPRNQKPLLSNTYDPKYLGRYKIYVDDDVATIVWSKTVHENIGLFPAQFNVSLSSADGIVYGAWTVKAVIHRTPTALNETYPAVEVLHKTDAGLDAYFDMNGNDLELSVVGLDGIKLNGSIEGWEL